MDPSETINIPAFQRKRSISARARKKPSYLTAKPTKTRKRTITRRTRTIEEPAIPARDIMPSDDLFQEPLMGDIEEPTITPITSDLREMKICGFCDGYFDKIDVAVIQLTSPIRINDRILIETDDGLFEQIIESMQIERKDVKLARSGSDIGLKVLKKPKVGGTIYKVIE